MQAGACDARQPAFVPAKCCVVTSSQNHHATNAALVPLAVHEATQVQLARACIALGAALLEVLRCAGTHSDTAHFRMLDACIHGNNNLQYSSFVE